MLEPLRNVFAQDGRREGPERLAELDLQVHDRLHLRRARVAQDAAPPEGARPELHPPLQQADDLLFGEKGGDDVRELCGRHRPERQPLRTQPGCDLLRGEGGAEEGPLHAVGVRRQAAPRCQGLPRPEPLRARTRSAHPAVPDGEGRAHGPSRVTGSRLDEEVFEETRALERPVRDAVQRDASGEAEVPGARELLRVPGHLQDDLLGDGLHGRREVHLALRQERLRSPRRPSEEALERTSRHRETVSELELVEVEPDRAVVVHLDDLPPDDVGEPRLSVGREPHQLVLAAVHLEPAEVGERRVEEADRVGEAQLEEHVERRALPVADRGRRPLADAVHRQDRRLLVRRREERRRRVRLVVLGEEDLSAVRELFANPVLHPELLAHPERHRLQEGAEAAWREVEVRLEEALELQERLVVEGDGVERGGLDAPLLQAPESGLAREAGVVLLPREALFLRGRDDLAVDDEGGGGVVVVGREAENAFRHDQKSV